jgi:hypothetical protein
MVLLLLPVFLVAGLLFSYSASAAAAWLFYICGLGFGTWLVYRKTNPPGILLPAAISGGVVSFVINYLEALNYDNFIYSHTHILPDHLAVFIGFLAGLYLLGKLADRQAILKLIMVPVVAFGTAGSLRASAIASSNLIIWLKSPQAIAGRAIAGIYGNDLEFINFVKDSTPENASIVIPPAAPGRRHTADPWLMASFLYPRKITGYVPGMNLLAYDYVVISSEYDTGQSSGQTWPDFNIGSALVTIYDWDNDWGVRQPGQGYYSRSVQNPPAWGLITIVK